MYHKFFISVSIISGLICNWMIAMKRPGNAVYICSRIDQEGSECEFETNRLREYVVHGNSHDEDKVLQCQECHYLNTALWKMEEHITNVHSVTDLSEISASYQKISKKDYLPFCFYCEQNVSDLNSHLKKRHSNNICRPYYKRYPKRMRH